MRKVLTRFRCPKCGDEVEEHIGTPVCVGAKRNRTKIGEDREEWIETHKPVWMKRIKLEVQNAPPATT